MKQKLLKIKYLNMENNLINFTFDDTKNIVDNKIRETKCGLENSCGSISVFMILQYWNIKYDICEFIRIAYDGTKKSKDDKDGSNLITLSYAILEMYRDYLTVDIYWEALEELNDYEKTLCEKIIEYGGTINKSLTIGEIASQLDINNIPIIGYNEHFSPLKGYQASNKKLYFPNYQRDLGDSDVLLETFIANWDKFKICIFLRQKNK